VSLFLYNNIPFFNLSGIHHDNLRGVSHHALAGGRNALLWSTFQCDSCTIYKSPTYHTSSASCRPWPCSRSAILCRSGGDLQPSGRKTNSGRLPMSDLVLFWPGLASKLRLWLGLRWLWLSQHTGQAKAVNQGLALAWPGPGHGFSM
jgi:hypothetical protein